MSEDLDRLQHKLSALSRAQLLRIEGLVDAVGSPSTVEYDISSKFFAAEFVDHFGEALRVHHAVSHENFTKDKFEHAMEAALIHSGINAKLAGRGNPGHDISVENERWSLKTQANVGIKQHEIHISKFMELGKGPWETQADLEGLRQRMFDHIRSYDRILTLRCLTPGRTNDRTYELVEIPLELFRISAGFPCRMMTNSRQAPKPGVCDVLDGSGLALQLYFDGGTERKLQIRKLRKDLCEVHATWRFTTGQ